MSVNDKSSTKTPRHSADSRKPRPRYTRRPLDRAEDIVVEVLLEDGALLTLHLTGVQSLVTRFEPTWGQSVTIGLAARDAPEGQFTTVARLEVADLVTHLLEHIPGVKFAISPT